MSSYYHKLLEQRDKFINLQSRKRKLYLVAGIIIVLVVCATGYFLITQKDSLGMDIGKPVVKIKIANSVKDEIQSKIDKFAQENPNLKFECDATCEKPDILFDNQEQPNFLEVELIGKFSASQAKYKFESPDIFNLSGLQEIWMMTQTGGKMVDDLKEYLKKSYSTEKITVNFVGDIMLSRTVDKTIEDVGSFTYPFMPMAAFLKNADITIGNLESPFFDQGAPVREGMVFKANPESISGLKYAGFDIVTLANNHFGNQGKSGMLYTFSLLSKNNINYIGAGKNLAKAKKILVKEINGVKIAFIGVENYSITPESYFAGQSSPGILHVEADQIDKYVKKAKKMADIVIVTYHGGTEYAVSANADQRKFARAAIDAGADIVIGHHPHVIEGVENYKGKMILYSLGNFVFDQMWSKETQQGLVAQLTFEGKLLTTIRLIPVHIYNYCQPRNVSILERDQIIDRLLKNSDL
jgi:poly-gamma-glutamate synthesis protein (capsule biosynthesis protein)